MNRLLVRIKKIYLDIHKYKYNKSNYNILCDKFYNYIFTQQEIADRLSITQSYVSKLLAKIVKKIGYQLEEKGIIEIDIKMRKIIKKYA